jgi:hypothetical protein
VSTKNVQKKYEESWRSNTNPEPVLSHIAFTLWQLGSFTLETLRKQEVGLAGRLSSGGIEKVRRQIYDKVKRYNELAIVIEPLLVLSYMALFDLAQSPSDKVQYRNAGIEAVERLKTMPDEVLDNPVLKGIKERATDLLQTLLGRKPTSA